MKNIVAHIALALLAAGPASAAVQLTSAAGSANGLSWSVGQLGSATFLSPTGGTILTQGMLQAPEVAYAGIDEVGVAAEVEISVGRNKIEILSNSDVEWFLYDSAARRVASGSAKTISTGNLAGGVYILTLSQSGGIKTFKKILKR